MQWTHDLFDTPPLDLYRTLYDGFGELRGWTTHEVNVGDAIQTLRVPATTCEDITNLALIWTRMVQRSPARFEALAPGAQRRRFRLAKARASVLCQGLGAAELYPENRAFWQALRGVAIACAVEREHAPRNAERDFLNSWKNVTITTDGGTVRATGKDATALDLKNALYFHFGDRRGWETHAREVKLKDDRTKTVEERYPKTTCNDVLQLAAFWTNQIQQSPKHYEDYVPGAQRRRWREAATEARQICAGLKPDDVYPKNRTFWKAMNAAAISIDVERDNVPTREIDAVIGFFGDVAETIAEGLSDVRSWAKEQIVDAAGAIGDAAGSAARGFFDQLGMKEVLIGAGVVAGAAFVLPKVMAKEKKPKAAAGGAA